MIFPARIIRNTSGREKECTEMRSSPSGGALPGPAAAPHGRPPPPPPPPPPRPPAGTAESSECVHRKTEAGLRPSRDGGSARAPRARRQALWHGGAAPKTPCPDRLFSNEFASGRGSRDS